MSANMYIEKTGPHPEGLDFAGLKKEGIRLLQELCGKEWTDYNLHDPGVTVLEQLCYALTDLMYRTQFDVADYLTGKDGGIDFENQALYRPQDIFPSQPITIDDYRKIIIDALPEIDNVWITTDTDRESVDSSGQPGNNNGRQQGMYCVYLNLKDTAAGFVHNTEREQVIEKVSRIYAANRNLCEDLKTVRVVEHRHYTLQADVEIRGTRDPAAILAEIYFKCIAYITPAIIFYSFEEMVRQGKSIEEIFTGPLTRHGYIERSALDPKREFVTTSELIGIIHNIEGVNYLHGISFEDEKGEISESIIYDSFPQSVPCLRFPSNDDDVGVKLYKNGRAHRIYLKDVRLEFERLDFEHRTLRHTRQDIDGVFTLPHGEFRKFDEYYSIQNQFPAIYGINSYGVPDSAASKRKAQARQLKAYLLFFEQIMANFLAGLQGISRLFSMDEHLQQSYFHCLLNNKNAPDVEGLYQREPAAVNLQIARILKHYDKFGDRRNRILDYLLAIYGEKFTQSSLRRFNYYYTDQELDRQLIDNKIKLLKHLVMISQQRAGAFNCRRASWNTDNTAGLKKKVSILLGLKYFQSRSLVDVFVEKGLELVSDEQFKRLKEGTVELEFVDIGDIDERIRQQFREVWPQKTPPTDDRRLFEQIIFLKNNVLSESILRNGIYLEKYRVGSTGADKAFQVVFKPDEGASWYYLASCETKNEASSAVNELCRFLIQLNVESEGFHIIEHILLRPLSRDTYDIPVPDDFYSFRISVIFPSWTARFNDREFRKLAEETVRLNCPAHVLPEFYWLDFSRMLQFERLYKDWLSAKKDADSEGADVHSKKMVLFLLENATESQNKKGRI